MPQATTTYPEKALSVYLQRLDRQTGQFRQAWRPAPSFDEQTHPKNLKTSLTEHWDGLIRWQKRFFRSHGRLIASSLLWKSASRQSDMGAVDLYQTKFQC